MRIWSEILRFRRQMPSRRTKVQTPFRPLGIQRLESRRMFDAGMLDESFGDGGVVILDFYQRLDFAHAAAVQTDGMTLVAGSSGRLEGIQSKTELTVARFDSNGILDPQFGDEGIAVVDFGDGIHGQANAIIVQDDGKIVVVGELQPTSQLVVLRLNTDGSLDESFDGGFVIMGASSSGRDVLLQSDGKIIVVGDAQGELGFQFFVARLNDDGSFDSDFGQEGVQVTNTLHPDGASAAVALQSDGKIVITGYGETVDPNLSKFITARLDSSGDLDAGYGDSGLAITAVTTSSRASDIAIDDQDRAIVVGSDDGNLVLLRYDIEGDLDDTFGQEGVVTIEDLNPVVSGTAGGELVIQSDGKLVVTATGGNDFVLVRLNESGSFDESFNGVGRVTTDLQVTFDSSTAVAINEDNSRIVVAGISGGDWAAVRYLGNDTNPIPWQNPENRLDVNSDGDVVPLDVLRIINELNQPTFADSSGKLPDTRPAGALYYDVDGNGFITPLDALGVINFLNQGAGESGSTWVAPPKELAVEANVHQFIGEHDILNTVADERMMGLAIFAWSDYLARARTMPSKK